jgi:hypothetical protein
MAACGIEEKRGRRKEKEKEKRRKGMCDQGKRGRKKRRRRKRKNERLKCVSVWGRVGLSMGQGWPFMAPHPAKNALEPCGAVGVGEGMHGVGIRGYAGIPEGISSTFSFSLSFFLFHKFSQEPNNK